MKTVYIFLMSLCMPIEFSIEVFGLRFTFYRLILLFLFFYLVFRLKVKTLQKFDYLIFAYGLLIIVSVLINNGVGSLEGAGIIACETLSPYLLARHFVTDEKKFIAVVQFVSTTVVVMAIAGVIESVTGISFLHILSRNITGYYYPIANEQRIGLTRASVTFEHPILFGTFCASVLSMTFFALKKRTLKLIGVFVATFSSLSSAPLLVFNLQVFFIFWDHVANRFKNKWNILYLTAAFIYVAISISSSRSPLTVILSYITFSSQTAYYRQLIWEYGTANVVSHPFFGIGFSDWERIEWMSSNTVDHFWLLTAMRYGLFALSTLLLAVFLIISQVNKAMGLSSSLIINRIRISWIFSMVSLIIAGCTVAYWNAIYVYFFFMLGMGVWMTKINDCKDY